MATAYPANSGRQQDTVRQLRQLEGDLDRSSMPSQEVRNPQDAVVLQAINSDNGSVRDGGDGRRAKPSDVYQEETQIWNHVKHLETQLEFLTSSHDIKADDAYNSELTKTVNTLAAGDSVPLGGGAVKNPRRGVQTRGAGGPAAAAGRKENKDEKKLWNAWDLRLNIGKDVGKWFGHDLGNPAYKEQPALDLGTDLAKTDGSSLPYTEVMEVNKRVKTVDTLTDLNARLETARKQWQDQLAVLQNAVKRSMKAAQSTHRAPPTELQETLALQVQELNRKFLQEVDTLLHEIRGQADIWGDMGKKDLIIETLEGKLQEFVVRLNEEITAGTALRGRLDQVVNDNADLKAASGEALASADLEKNKREESELKNKWLEEELKTTQEELKRSEQALKANKVKLTKESQDSKQAREALLETERSLGETANETQSLLRRLQKEEELRAGVAKECADTQIRLTHALEELDAETQRLRRLQGELETANATISAYEDREAAHAGATSLTADLIEARTRLAEATQVANLLRAERADALAAADSFALQLREHITANKDEVEVLTRDLEEARTQLPALQQAKIELEEKNELIMNELEELQNREQAERSIGEMKELLDEALKLNNTYSTQLAQLRETEARLTRELTEARNELASTKQAKAAMEQETGKTQESLREDLEKYREEAAGLRNNLNEDSKRMREKDEALTTSSSNAEELAQLVAVLRAEKSVLRTELSEYEADLEREVHERTQAEESYQAALKREAELRQKLDNASHMIESLTQVKAKLEDQAHQLENRLTTMAGDNAALAHRLDEARRSWETERRMRAELEEERARVHERLNQSHLSYEDAVSVRDQREHQNNDLMRELSLEQFEHRRTKERLEDAQRWLQDARDALTTAKTAEAATAAEMHTLRQKLQEETNERRSQQQQNGALERQIIHYKEAIEDAKATAASTVKDGEEAVRALDSERTERKGLAATLKTTKTNFEQLRKENEELIEQKKIVDADLSHVRKKLQELTSERTKLARRADDQEGQLAELRVEMDELTRTKDGLAREVEVMQASLRLQGREKADFELRKMNVEQELVDARARLDAAAAKELALLAEWRAEKERYEEELHQRELADMETKRTLQADIATLQRNMSEMLMQSQLKFGSLETELNNQQKACATQQARADEAVDKLGKVLDELEQAQAQLDEEKAARSTAESQIAVLDSRAVKLEESRNLLLSGAADKENEAQREKDRATQLASQLEAAEARSTNDRQLLADAEAAADKARTATRVAEQECKDLQTEAESTGQELARLKEKIAAATESHNTALKEADDARVKIAELEKEHKKDTLSLETANAEVESYKDKVRAVLKEKSDLALAKEALEAELQRVKKDNIENQLTKSRLTATLQAQEQEIKDNKARYEREEAHRQRAEQNVAALEQSIQAVQARERETLARMNEDARAAAAAKQSASDADVTAARLKERWTTERAARAQAEAALEAERDLVRVANLEKADAVRTTEAIRTRIAEMEAARDAAIAESNRSAQEKEAAVRARQDMVGQLEAAKLTAAERTQAKEAADHELTQERGRLQEANALIARLEGEIEEARQRLQGEETAHASTKAMLEDMTRTLANEGKEKTAAEVARMEYERKLAELTAAQEAAMVNANLRVLDAERIKADALSKEAEARRLLEAERAGRAEEAESNTASQRRAAASIADSEARFLQSQKALADERERCVKAEASEKAMKAQKEEAVLEAQGAAAALAAERKKHAAAQEELMTRLDNQDKELATARATAESAVAAGKTDQQARARAEGAQAAAEGHAAQLEEQMGPLRNEVSKMTGIAGDNATRARELETLLAKATIDLEEANHMLANERANAATQIASAKATQSAAESAAAARAAELEDSRSELAATKVSLLSERQASAARATTEAELLGKITSQQEASAAQDAKLRAAEAAAATASGDATKKTAEAAEAKARADKAAADAAALSQVKENQSAAAKAAADEAQATAADASRKLSLAEQALEDAKAEAEAAKIAAANADKKAQQAQAEAAAARNELTAERANTQSASARENTLKELLAAEQAKVAAKETEVRAAKTAAEAARAQLDAVKQASPTKDAAGNQAAATSESLAASQAQLAALQQQLSQAEARAKEAEAAAQAAKLEQADAKAESEFLHEQNHKLEEDNLRLRSDADEIQQRLMETNSMLRQQQDQAETLRATMEDIDRTATATETSGAPNESTTDQELAVVRAELALLTEQLRQERENRREAEAQVATLSGNDSAVPAAGETSAASGGSTPREQKLEEEVALLRKRLAKQTQEQARGTALGSSKSPSAKTVDLYKQEVTKLRHDKEEEVKIRLELAEQVRKLQAAKTRLQRQLDEARESHAKSEEHMKQQIQQLKEGDVMMLMMATNEDLKNSLEKAKTDSAEAKRQSKLDKDRITDLQHQVNLLTQEKQVLLQTLTSNEERSQEALSRREGVVSPRGAAIADGQKYKEQCVRLEKRLKELEAEHEVLLADYDKAMRKLQARRQSVDQSGMARSHSTASVDDDAAVERLLRQSDERNARAARDSSEPPISE